MTKIAKFALECSVAIKQNLTVHTALDRNMASSQSEPISDTQQRVIYWVAKFEIAASGWPEGRAVIF